MTAEEPRPAELSRRVDDLRDEMRTSFRDIGVRLDRMPTNDILLAYLATRDQQMNALEGAVKELTAGLTQERVERIAAVDAEEQARNTAIKEQDARIEGSRRWGIGIALTGLGTLVGVVGFILNASGGAS